MMRLVGDVLTERTLPSDSPLVSGNRDEVMELTRRHGEDPNDVYSIEYVTTPARWLVFSVFLSNGDGRRYLECGCGGRFQRQFADGSHEEFHKGPCYPATTVRAHRLVGELPAWWKPARKSKQRRH